MLSDERVVRVLSAGRLEEADPILDARGAPNFVEVLHQHIERAAIDRLVEIQVVYKPAQYRALFLRTNAPCPHHLRNDGVTASPGLNPPFSVHGQPRNHALRLLAELTMEFRPTALGRICDDSVAQQLPVLVDRRYQAVDLLRERRCEVTVFVFDDRVKGLVLRRFFQQNEKLLLVGLDDDGDPLLRIEVFKVAQGVVLLQKLDCAVDLIPTQPIESIGSLEGEPTLAPLVRTITQYETCSECATTNRA